MIDSAFMVAKYGGMLKAQEQNGNRKDEKGRTIREIRSPEDIVKNLK